MSQEQIELITVDTLLDKVRAKREQGHRLVQMSATRLPDQVELTYSFDLDSRLTAVETRLPSISSIYDCAILYENEIHDLFNVKVDGLTVDFHGNFYKTAIKFPFGSTKVACASSATTPVSGTASCATAPAANPGATK
jgi:ech hydrogenase subunit D